MTTNDERASIERRVIMMTHIVGQNAIESFDDTPAFVGDLARVRSLIAAGDWDGVATEWDRLTQRVAQR